MINLIMKLLLAAGIIALFSFIFAANAMTTQCSQFSNEQGCENSGCSWCDRCSEKEINNYAADKCVDSNLQCTYSCSKTCGANCTTDSDCAANLTDTTCFFAGKCGTCKCSYQSVGCQKNGTIKEQYGDQICYYGPRSCTSSGCSVSSCALRAGQICDPFDGCVSCGQDYCGGNEFIIDKKCAGSDIIGKKINYFCGGGQCNVTSSSYLEKCKNGCNNAQCRDELCNINGLNTDCNKFDGYYGETYCKGNDVYKEYRDYKCGSNECAYTGSEVKVASCSDCQNGRCYDTGVVVNINSSASGAQGSSAGQGGGASPRENSNASLPSTISGGRVYNGFFFGSNSINTKLNGKGEIKFKVMRTNGVGTLTIENNGQAVLSTRATGDYSLHFSDSNLKIYTTSSGWLFFMPAVYDVGNIDVIYRD